MILVWKCAEKYGLLDGMLWIFISDMIYNIHNLPIVWICMMESKKWNRAHDLFFLSYGGHLGVKKRQKIMPFQMASFANLSVTWYVILIIFPLYVYVYNEKWYTYHFSVNAAGGDKLQNPLR